MKVLYVYNFAYPDYQSDTVYHGLIDSGIDVYETHDPSYMLKSFDSLTNIYGKGFSIFGKLTHTPKVESGTTIIHKIKNNFYDLVIYGCVYNHEGMPNRQCLDYLDEVIKHYPKNRIHFIDGSDNSWNFAHADGIASYGTVWKSQLMDIGAANPICFGIPESQFIKTNPKKEKLFAHIIPGKQKTYVYGDEKTYYHDYAISHYGLTWKKGQWNCMRHLEILANKCIPYFPDIDECPPFIMTDFPKDIIKETNRYARRYEIHPQYEWINDYLFEYSKNNLTTKKIAEKIVKASREKIHLPLTVLSDASPENPYIKVSGASSHPYTEIIEDAYQKSLTDQTKLPEWIVKYKGASGKRYRYMINDIISQIEDPRYLEIGVWTGSTLFAAMANNKVKVTAIDNWTKGFYGDVRDWFYENLNKCKTADQEIKIYETEFQKIDYSTIGKYNVFLYDGPHDESEQYDGVTLPYECLDDTFILIVDDWNWPGPRNGTLNALRDKNIDVLYSLEIRTTSNDYFPPDECQGENHNWHDGYFIAVCKKR